MASLNGAERINLFALVVYIPDPLATFLDDLRRELVPGCFVHAHVTILPPRPLRGESGPAIERARDVVAAYKPFEIEAGEVEIFPSTDVIYLGIKKGERELREMYSALNGGPLAFREEFPYHPHITLAQNLQPQQVAELAALARRRWAEFSHARSLHAERACFVQSTRMCTWVDLADITLGAVPLAR
jgi:2'-5' RNA ligase